MKTSAWRWDVTAGAALAGALLVLGSLRRPAAVEAAQEEAPKPDTWFRVVETRREIRERLLDQPDVRRAELSLFTPEGRPLLVVIGLEWETPTPPPPRRLEAIARWARERFSVLGPCEVHVVDAPHRRCVLTKDGAAFIEHP